MTRASVSAADFKRALGQLASGVTVVTTRNGRGQPLGLTVSAFCSVSLDPPLVLACIGGEANANTGLRESGRFGVSLLAEGQEEWSRRFAGGGPAKFSEQPMDAGPAGMPLVPGALATLECRVVAVHPAGDHVIYVGQVEAVGVAPGRPLLYQDRAYRKLGDPA